MIATLKQIDRRSADIYSFWFQTNKPISNEPGQYIDLTVPHTQPDEKGIKRKFTVYSSPSEPLMAITTKINPNNSSYKKALLALNIGDQLSFTEPMGDFILPIDQSIPLLFVAGGIGITPFRSIIKWLQDNQQSREIQLIYAVNNLTELLDQHLFDTISATYLIKNPPFGQHSKSGQLNTKAILNLSSIKPKTHIYLSGPDQLVTSITKDLHSRDLPKHQIITDIFTGY